MAALTTIITSITCPIRKMYDSSESWLTDSQVHHTKQNTQSRCRDLQVTTKSVVAVYCRVFLPVVSVGVMKNFSQGMFTCDITTIWITILHHYLLTDYPTFTITCVLCYTAISYVALHSESDRTRCKMRTRIIIFLSSTHWLNWPKRIPEDNYSSTLAPRILLHPNKVPTNLENFFLVTLLTQRLQLAPFT
jgi:hypothetical protein